MQDPEFQEEPSLYSSGGTSRFRQPEPNIWQKMSRLLELVIYFLLILGFAKVLAPDLRRQKDLEKDLVRLEKVKREKEVEVSRLRKEHSNLTSDRLYLEAVARDRLNLQRDGEYVIHIER